MIQRVLVVLFMLVSIASPLPASAQKGPDAPDIVVQGTKTGTPLDQLTGAVTIVDEATIRDMRVPTVLEVLRQVEGLDVVQSGGPGATTSIFVRGGNSNHVLVLMDGVKVNNPTTGKFDTANLTVDQIARIEVLRGSQSALYGSEALSGVINIITKRGREGDNDQLTIEGGAYRTWRGLVSHSGRGPIWDRTLSIDRWISRGFSRANEDRGNTEPDGYANTTFVTRMGRGMGVGGRMDLNVRLTDATVDTDDFLQTAPYIAVDDPSKTREKSALIGLTLSAPITAQWDHRLVVGWSRNRHTLAQSASGFDTDTDAQSQQVDWQHTLSTGTDHLVTIGYEHLRSFGRSITGYGAYDKRVVTNAVYVQDQLAAFDPLFFTAALRTDGHSQFGRHNTYKVGSSLALAGWHTRVFTNYATGFRAPTLDDLFSPPFPGYPPLSNPSLQPETSKGYEVGLTHAPGSGAMKLGATYFQTAYKNLIEGYPLRNVNTAEAQGIEASSEWTATPQSTIQANYTYTGTRNGTTAAQLLRRPRTKAAISLAFHPEQDSTLRLDYRYVGERLDTTDGFTLVTIPSYTLVNLAASQQWTSHTSLFMRVDNLFDRKYEEVTGYGTPGRSFYAGLTTTF